MTKLIPSRGLRNLLLLISALGALGLFLAPSTLVALMLGAIYGVLLVNLFLQRNAPEEPAAFQPGALLPAILFTAVGYRTFFASMLFTGPMTALSRRLGLGDEAAVRLVAAVGSVVGFYAFYRLAAWMERRICQVLNLTPEYSRSVGNLINLIFPISAAAFLFMEREWNDLLFCALLAGVAVALMISMHLPSLADWCRRDGLWRQLFTGLTALGILLFRAAGRDLISILVAAAAFPFVFLCLTALYRWLEESLCGLFDGVTRREWMVYSLLLLLALSFVTAVFLQTEGFYGTDHEFDIIYTADSPKLVQENVYLSLRHQENDLRQPLFAVFAAPFLGIPWLVGHCFGLTVQALLMDYVQIVMLMLTAFLLARMMKLTPGHRICFLVFSAFTYPSLLFLLMMEQYIVACFWLVLCLYLIVEGREQKRQALWGVGGTLLTGMILLPAMSRRNPVKDFSGWVRDMLDCLLEFAVFLLAFGRLDIILKAPTQILEMTKFTGKALGFSEKFRQFTEFFRDCLIFPAAGEGVRPGGYACWQLDVPEGLCLVGICVLLAAVFSALCNRKDPASRAAGLWLGFSFVVLLILGWGTQENGLVLYSLYFGWPVHLLLFRLMQNVEKRIPHAAAVLSLCSAVLLAAVNLPAIWAVVRFAIANYPI